MFNAQLANRKRELYSTLSFNQALNLFHNSTPIPPLGVRGLPDKRRRAVMNGFAANLLHYLFKLSFKHSNGMIATLLA